MFYLAVRGGFFSRKQASDAYLQFEQTDKILKMAVGLKMLNEKVSQYCIYYMFIIIASAKFTSHGLQLVVRPNRKVQRSR